MITMLQNLLHTDYGSGALYWAVSGYVGGCGYRRGVAKAMGGWSLKACSPP